MSKSNYHKDDTKQLPEYFFNLFTIEGHTKWRAHLSMNLDGFVTEWASDKNRPKITARKQYRVDRMTGEITGPVVKV